jgi:hypothetical protein
MYVENATIEIGNSADKLFQFGVAFLASQTLTKQSQQKIPIE